MDTSKQDKITRNVLKLSGGQQQRVAIAQALAFDAPVILADEPTGNLDTDTADEITAVLKESAHGFRKCVVVVMHDREVARKADVVLEIKRIHMYRLILPENHILREKANHLANTCPLWG